MMMQFSCLVCNTVTGSLDDTVNHIANHFETQTGKKAFQFECTICHQKSVSIGSFINHVEGKEEHRASGFVFNESDIKCMDTTISPADIASFRYYVQKNVSSVQVVNDRNNPVA